MKTPAFLIRVAICFLLSLVPLSEVEQWIYSVRVQLRGQHKTPSNIVILELDSSTFKSLKRQLARVKDSRGQSWNPEESVSPSAPPPGPSPKELRANRLEGLRDLFFWDPAVFRELLRRSLAQDPQAVLVTWDIPNEIVESLSDPGVELLARNPKIYWASHFDSEGKFQRPTSLLTSETGFGFNNLLTDSDGVIRQAYRIREGHRSLAQTLWSGTNPSQELTARQVREPFLINYSGSAGTVPSCSVTELFRPSHQCGDLKGKIVLLARSTERVGISSAESAFFRTPLGDMSRAEILGNEIHTLINHKPIYRASWIELSLIILATIIGSAFYIIYYPVMVSAISIIGTGSAVVLVLFQVIFQLFDIYIPSANIIASALITYLVFTGYRLAFQENLQWRSLKQAQYLRELDQMKTNFLSLVSHDLKTPLAKIQAAVERLRREPEPPKDLLDSIENSGKELQSYINSILNLSRIESQKVILKKKSNDINRIVEQTLRRLRSLAASKGIQIEAKLEPLFAFEFDEDLIRQVLTNLVDNAIKYSPSGSQVIVSTREEDGFVRVDVKDFGPGIPKDQLPFVFRKFSRLVSSVREQVKGTGLGLYLSKYFIEMHGGRIQVKTEEGKGTVFTFFLPLKSDEDSGAKA